MSNQLFENIKLHVTHLLKNLHPDLTYHNGQHTFDVLAQCERIAKEEGITDPQQLLLLKVAALYHDTGFLNVYKKHEEESCTLFLSDCTHYPFSKEEKESILQLIMATQLPQQPTNVLEKVICDADLDYLGRADFLETGARLKQELMNFGKIRDENEWEELQLHFLKEHTYHTASSRALREPVKQRNILQLQQV
jgi:uncharacterized protein